MKGVVNCIANTWYVSLELDSLVLGYITDVGSVDCDYHWLIKNQFWPVT